MCRGLGHNNKFECSEFKFKYGVAPLKKNDKKARDNLAESLNQIDSYVIYKRAADDKRPILDSIPMSGVSAIVIHKRYQIDEMNMSSSYRNNICIECKIIKPGLIEHDLYTKKLCLPSPVMIHIYKSTTHIIGTQL